MIYNPDLKKLAERIERYIDYARNMPGIGLKVEAQIITHVGIITIVCNGWCEVKLNINQGREGEHTFIFDCADKYWYDDGDKSKHPWSLLDVLETMEDFAVACLVEPTKGVK